MCVALVGITQLFPTNNWRMLNRIDFKLRHSGRCTSICRMMTQIARQVSLSRSRSRFIFAAPGHTCFTKKIIMRRTRGQGGGHDVPPPLSKVLPQVSLCPPPPTFGQSKCSNFFICSYLWLKRISPQIFLLASLANFN